MTGREVGALLREISQLLQLKGENAFKVRAYDLAADAFEALPPDPAAPGGLYERVKNGTLSELSGVGKAIDQKVTELVRTGSLRYLEELRREFPHGALDLVQIRSEEHTSELQSPDHLVCRLLLEKKKKIRVDIQTTPELTSTT